MLTNRLLLSNKFNENGLVKFFSKQGFGLVIRLNDSQLRFISKDSNRGVSVYARLLARYMFIHYKCEGVSELENEIYVDHPRRSSRTPVEQARISVALSEPHSQQLVHEALVPEVARLLQAVDGLLDQSHLHSADVHAGYLHVHRHIDRAGQVRILDVHMMDLHSELIRDRQEPAGKAEKKILWIEFE